MKDERGNKKENEGERGSYKQGVVREITGTTVESTAGHKADERQRNKQGNKQTNKQTNNQRTNKQTEQKDKIEIEKRTTKPNKLTSKSDKIKHN